jgi:hypothetical protein
MPFVSCAALDASQAPQDAAIAALQASQTAQDATIAALQAGAPVTATEVAAAVDAMTPAQLAAMCAKLNCPLSAAALTAALLSLPGAGVAGNVLTIVAGNPVFQAPVPGAATSVPAAGVTAGTFVSGVNIPASQVTGLSPAVQTVINTASIPAAQLTGVVPAANLPSYVDDVLEFANLAALPATGEAGKIYVTADTSFIYRWSGSGYVQITSGGGAATVPASGVLAGTLGSGVQVNSTSNFGAGAAATTTAQGVVELATPAETAAGTSTTLAVTPAGVAAAIAGATPAAATDTTLGVVENATAAEVAAGTLDGAVSISPKDLLDGLNAPGALKSAVTAIAAAAAGTPPAASDTTAGISALNLGTAATDAINATDALTAAGLAAILNGTAPNPTPNALQAAVGRNPSQYGTLAGVGAPTAAPSLANPATEITNANGEVFRWNGTGWYLSGNGYGHNSGLIVAVTPVSGSAVLYTFTVPRSGTLSVAGKASFATNTPVPEQSLGGIIGGIYLNNNEIIVQALAPAGDGIANPFNSCNVAAFDVTVAAGDVLTLVVSSLLSGISRFNNFSLLYKA